jgi:hypothetical protein
LFLLALGRQQPRDMINMEIIFCPNFEKKYGRLVKEIWSDFSVLLRKFP